MVRAIPIALTDFPVNDGGRSCRWPASSRTLDGGYLPTGQLHGPGSPADCCFDLRAGLLADPAFTETYEGPGATILRVDRQAMMGGH